MAGNASAIRAGGAYVELFTDDSKLTRGLGAASAKLKAWGASVTALGARTLTAGLALTGGLLASAKVFADLGDQFARASDRTGIAVETLSALSFAASQSGTDFATLENSLGKVQTQIQDAIVNGGQAAVAFARLGTSAAALKKMSGDEQLRKLADGFARISNDSQRSALATKVFGDAGRALLPLLRQGAIGLDAFIAKAKELGVTMSGEDAAAAVQLKQAMDLLSTSFKFTVARIGSALAPALVDLAGRMAEGSRKVAEWVKENRGLIIVALKVGAAAVAAGVGLLVLGKALAAAGVALGIVKLSLGLVAGAVTFLTGPVGLAVLAIGGLTAAWINFTDSGQRAGEIFSSTWTNAKQDFLAAFGGIMTALKSGDLELAMKIAGVGLTLVWLDVVDGLRSAWAEFTGFLKDSLGPLSAMLKQQFDTFISPYLKLLDEFRRLRGANAAVDEGNERENVMTRRRAAMMVNRQRRERGLTELGEDDLFGAARTGPGATPTGTPESRAARKALQDELARLNEEAERKRKEFDARVNEGTGRAGQIPGAEGDTGIGSSFGSFFAAALEGQGIGGINAGVERRLDRVIEELHDNTRAVRSYRDVVGTIAVD